MQKITYHLKNHSNGICFLHKQHFSHIPLGVYNTIESISDALILINQ